MTFSGRRLHEGTDVWTKERAGPPAAVTSLGQERDRFFSELP